MRLLGKTPKWILAALILLLNVFIGLAHSGLGSGPVTYRVDRLKMSGNSSPEASHSNPDPIEFGNLVFRGGFQLSSSSKSFGGFSGLIIKPDGKGLIAVSDGGWWLAGDLVQDHDQNLTGITNCRLKRIMGPNRQPLKNNSWTDAEGLTAARDGSLAISFEQRHRIWIYPPKTYPLEGSPQDIPLPQWLKSAPDNSGLEAITWLENGDLLVIAEDFGKGGLTLGAIKQADTWRPIQYQRKNGFKPTAAATLPNGDVLILERRFTLLAGFEARLVRLPKESILPGKILIPVPLADIQNPLPLDNYEGLHIRADAQGRIFIYLISDDNFLALQQTLIMMFELIG